MDGEDRTYSSFFQSTHNIESSSLDTRKKNPSILLEF